MAEPLKTLDFAIEPAASDRNKASTPPLAARDLSLVFRQENRDMSSAGYASVGTESKMFHRRLASRRSKANNAILDIAP